MIAALARMASASAESVVWSACAVIAALARIAARPAAGRLRAAAIRNLGQRSTYEGLPVTLAGLGCALRPEHATQLVTAGALIAGLVRTVWPDAGDGR